MRPQRWQPTRLLCPWDSPGKNTGVGCHFLLQCVNVKSESDVDQSCLTLSDPMDCSPSGPSVHGIFQARVLEWGAIAFSEGLPRFKKKVPGSKFYWMQLTSLQGNQVHCEWSMSSGSWKIVDFHHSSFDVPILLTNNEPKTKNKKTWNKKKGPASVSLRERSEWQSQRVLSNFRALREMLSTHWAVAGTKRQKHRQNTLKKSVYQTIHTSFYTHN